MQALLPLVTLVLFLILAKLALYRSGQPSDWRLAFMLAAVVTGLLVALFTEILSSVKAFTATGVMLLWLAVVLGAAARLLTLRAQLSPALAFERPSLTRVEIAELLGIGIIVGVTLLIALLAPPNNWDSHAYHMPRVMHWIQNQSVAFYPTHIDRQLHQPPWSEYAIAHLQLLLGGDQLANLVQWGSMVSSAIAISLIAGELGAERRGQILAAVAVVTLPLGILEATSTQNDYVVTFWLASIAYYTLRAYHQGLTKLNVAGYATSMALAIFTKGTAYFFAFPFVLALTVIGFRQARWRFWLPALAIVVVVVTVNGPHLWRTARVFSSPIGPTDLHRVDNISPATLASNVLRHVMMNVYMPTESSTGPLNQAVDAFHAVIGLDKNDPRTTFEGNRFSVPFYMSQYGISPRGFHEDRAGNPLHLLVVGTSCLLVLLTPSLRQRPGGLLYLGLIVGGFLIFSLFVKWQSFATRLQLPLFVLFAPLIAVVFSSLPGRVTPVILAVALFAGSLPFLLINYSRPALPPAVRTLTHERSIYSTRVDQLFTNRPEMQEPYEQTAALLKDTIEATGCEYIGLVMVKSVSAWEYPLWALLDRDRLNFEMQHVLVQNESRVLLSQPPFRDFEPCILVLLDEPLDEEAISAVGDEFTLVGDFPPGMSVFLRKGLES